MRAIRPLDYALSVLFPRACALCRAPTATAETLCPSCWRETPFLDTSGCSKCSRPVVGADGEIDPICDDCLRYPPRWRRGRAALRYEDAGRRLVLGLKHGDRLDFVPMLAGWMARVGADLIAEADLIAPIPLHWTRRLKRRGNQSAVLARSISQRTKTSGAFAPRLLVRTRSTPSQDGRGRDERVANLAGALSLGSPSVDGRRVLLVDDVLTTGATLNTAANCCYAGGALSVDVLVLALVVRDPDVYMSPNREDEGYEVS